MSFTNFKKNWVWKSMHWDTNKIVVMSLCLYLKYIKWNIYSFFAWKWTIFFLFICFLENILFFILYSPQNYLYYISRKLSFNQFFFFFKWISRLLTYAHWEWHDWQITYKSPLAWNPRCMYYYSTLDILFYSQKFHVYSMYGLCWTNKVIYSFRTVKWRLPIGGGTNAPSNKGAPIRPRGHVQTELPLMYSSKTTNSILYIRI